MSKHIHEVIYLATEPNKPTYYMTEPTKTRQGEWTDPYVPKEKLDDAEKRIKELQDEVLNLSGQLNAQPAMEKS